MRRAPRAVRRLFTAESPRGFRFRLAPAMLIACSLVPVALLSSSDKQSKPKLSVRASPSVAFAPARISLVAEIKGGPDDYAEFYCATVEWDWGDGTQSERSFDCDPYEAGKSEITRRFSIEHIFHIAGDYRIRVRLKQKDDPVAAANTTVRVRPGIGGGGIGGR